MIILIGYLICIVLNIIFWSAVTISKIRELEDGDITWGEMFDGMRELIADNAWGPFIVFFGFLLAPLGTVGFLFIVFSKIVEDKVIIKRKKYEL